MTGTSLRLIVADDHRLYRESIVRTLRRAGETVVAEATDGTSALALIRQHRPDVALVDVRMPGLDGIAVVAALAHHGPDVPVVLLSAFDEEPLIFAGLEAGAAAYLTKDADREVILSAVRAAFGP
jgi:DNA-binding NarL/FixJ family response regulator